MFLDSDFVTDLTSIGTLFAFVLVCGGILLLPRRKKEKGKFRIPYVNSKYIVPGLFILTVLIIQFNNPSFFSEFFSLADPTYAGMPHWKVFFEKLPYFAFIILSLGITISVICEKPVSYSCFGIIILFLLVDRAWNPELGTLYYLVNHRTYYLLFLQ